MAARPTPRRLVDARFVRLVAYKRVITGALGIVAGPLTLAAALRAPWKTTESAMLGVIGLLVFAGGGAWALRDGLRLLRDLRNGG